MLPALLKIAPFLWEMFNGKKEQVVAGRVLEVATKGLLRSKTARAATAGLGMKLAGIYMLPIPPILQHIGAAAAVIEWGVTLYLRVVTKEPV